MRILYRAMSWNDVSFLSLEAASAQASSLLTLHRRSTGGGSQKSFTAGGAEVTGGDGFGRGRMGCAVERREHARDLGQSTWKCPSAKTAC